MPSISIVVPVYNEAENTDELYRRTIGALRKDFPGFGHEIIFVDDGSSDTTFTRLEELNRKDPAVKALQFSRNFLLVFQFREFYTEFITFFL